MSTLSKQQGNPTQYAEQGHFVSELGMPVVSLLSPRTDEAASKPLTAG